MTSKISGSVFCDLLSETQSTGLRFVQEIKIIFKYRDCLKVLRIVICIYKDLVVVWVLSFKEWKNGIMKYCLYEEPGPKKDSNQHAPLQTQARVLKFLIQQVQVLYYLRSEQQRC